MRVLLMVVLGFGGATALCQYLSPAGWLMLLLAALFLAGWLFLRRKETDFMGRAALVALGAAAALLYNALWIHVVTGAVAERISPEREVSAQVLTYPEETDYGYRVQVKLLGEHLLVNKGMYYGGLELEAAEPGDLLTGAMEVRDASEINGERITTFTSRGLWFLLYPQDEVSIEQGGFSLRFLPQYLREQMERQIDRLYAGEIGGFLKALLLGVREDLSEGRSSDLGEVGIYHITAVSGLHCGFLLTVIGTLIGWKRERLLAAVAIPVLILYTLMVGCPPSMIRASVMLSIVLLAPLFRREPDPLTSLAFALLLLLLANPYSIASVGLQLSFASMVGLLAAAPGIYRVLPKAKSRRFNQMVLYPLAVSVGCMVFTTPLTAVYFNYLPLVGPLANLLTMTAASLTYAAGVFSVLLSFLFFPLGQLLALAGRAGAWYILTVARLLVRIPYHAVYFSNPYLKYWLVYVLALFVYCALTPPARRKYLLATVLSVGMLAGVLYLPIRERQGMLHAVAVDVGQGASTVLASRNAAALVDCGSSNSFIGAGNNASDVLNAYGYLRLDYLILTHYDSDHVNGLEVLLSRIPVERIFAPVPGEEGDLGVSDLAEEWEVPITYVTEDAVLPLGEASLTVFAPVAAGDSNESGLSVLCTAGAFDLLITGDLSRAGEKALVETKALPKLEVLMVGHHGSANSTSEELLEALQPQTGIISVGSNSYGHPAWEAQQRMVRQGMTLWRTDLQGNVSIVVTEETGGIHGG